MWYILSMNRKGQNTVEYILLVVAVLLVFIVFLSPQGPYKTTVEKILFNTTVNQLQGLSDEIKLNNTTP